jgi:dTDP-4-dehydrorhamnose reductase
VNSAAFTAVDAAETECDMAFKVNRDAVRIMANSCNLLSIPLIHISTDYVFDGTKAGSYKETDLICPIGVYGRSKEAGEAIVRELLEKHIILRTSWVYAAHGNNFVKTMLRIGKERQNLNIVNDQFGAPTFAGDIADAILSIAKKVLEHDALEFWGTYHYTAKGRTSWKDFAEVIFETASTWLPNKPNVEGIPSSQYPTAAKRPANSVLNCAKVDSELGPPRRHWREGLDEVLDELKNEPK